MRTQFSFPYAVVSACLLLGSVATGSAASLGASFVGRGGGAGAIMAPTDSAGVVAQTFWNNIDSGDPPVDGSSLALIDSAGSFTAVKVVYDASDSWNSDGPTTTGNDKLMKGIIKANPDPDTAPINNSERILFVITNLPAGSTFDVLVYASENGALGEMSVALGATTYYILEQNNFNGTFVEATSTSAGAYTDANYARFNGVAPAANGTITITCLKGIADPQLNDGIGVAGIQLLQVTGPNPAPNTDTCSITAHPQATFAVVGGTATFTVGTQGPSKVQWTKNNVAIPGAVNPTLVYTPTLADDNSEIRAVVFNNVNTNTSTAATLFVDPATPPSLTQGFLTANRWTGMTGDAAQPIRDAIASATAPNSTFFVPGPNMPQTNPDLNDFGVRLSGWLKPLVTGYYDFFTRSDNASQVFLNSVNAGTGTNTLPDVNVDIPICEEAVTFGEAFKEPNPGLGQPFETTSEPIFLEAGKLYGLVVLYKEGTGGDFLQVAWRLTNDTTAALSLKPIGGASCFTMASGAGQRASITSQPTSTQVVEVRPASFSVGVSTLPVGGLFAAQWLKNGTPIPGATDAQYKTPPTTLADNNAQFQAIVYTLRGPLTSSPPAVLTVIPDTFPPIPAAGAITKVGGGIQVGIGFDEAVNQTDLVPANFSVIGAATATVTFPTNSFNDYKGVLIDTTGLVPGNTYTARVSNVRDLKGNQIPAAGVNATFTVGSNIGWADTGTPKRPGQVVPVGVNGFDILNGGRGEWGSYDEATIAYVRKTNDFDVKVQLIYAEPGSQWTRVGLMARNDLNVLEDPIDRNLTGSGSTASAYAQTHMNPNQTLGSSARYDPTGALPVNQTPNNGHEQNQRLAMGIATTGWGSGVAGNPVYPDEWLRLQRQGNTLRGFRGQDGVNWIDQGTTVLTDQQPHMFVGAFAAVETGNIWAVADHDVYGPFDPKYDRLFVYQFRNFGDVVTVTTPTLSVSQSGGNVIVTYTGVLQSATIVTGPYGDVSGATSPYSTSPTGPGRYFRARSQ